MVDFDFNFNEPRLKAKLYLVTEGFADIDLDASYEYNCGLVLSFFKRYPDAMISYLTLKTLDYILHCINVDLDYEIDPRYFLNEDFRLLVALNIIDYKTLKFNPLYKEPFTKAFNYMVDYEKIITFQTVLRGMLDVYGIIETKELETLMKLYLPDYIDQLVELDLFLERAGIIFPYISIGENYVCRREVTPVLQDVLKIRKIYEHINYKIYPTLDLINFAATFTFNGVTKLALDNGFNRLVYQKYLVYFLEPRLAVRVLGYEIKNKEDWDILYEYNVDYPKWLLKGHSLLSVHEKYDEDIDLEDIDIDGRK